MTVGSGNVAEVEQLKYPKAIFFIIFGQLCESFSFLGIDTILCLYLKTQLNYDDDTATITYHLFWMLLFCFPLFGAILADSIFGKFKTIMYLGIVSSLGQFLLSASNVPIFGLPIREFSIVALLLIAVGSGGVKACVPALGGDQFILPRQEKHLAVFFSVYYLVINFSMLIATFLIPELRSGAKCFGQQECYSVTLFVLAIFMTLAIAIFFTGKPLYRVRRPQGNVVLNVIKCVSHALRRKSTTEIQIKREHWLDYADDKYNAKFIAEIKATLQILILFIPIPFFYALYEQQGSRWTFQASSMDGQLGGFIFKADQMRVLNPLLVIIFVPIFEVYIYPAMAKIKVIDTPLKKLTAGGILAAVAFLISAFLELKLEATYPILPTNGLAQLRIINPRDCHLPVTINNHTTILEPFGMWKDTSAIVTGNHSIPFRADFSQCGGRKNITGFIMAVENQATTYVLEYTTPYGYRDRVGRTEDGNPAIRVLTYNTLNPFAKTKVELSGVDHVFKTKRMGPRVARKTTLAEFSPGKYRVKVNGKKVGEITMRRGGVYTLQVLVTPESKRIRLTTITAANSIHILWLIPQYVVMTMGEVMFIITGLEFAFTQAPSSMKSLVQAAWLLTDAIGNLIVVLIAKVNIFERQVFEFILFAVLMLIAMLIFAIMATFYKYKTFDHDDDDFFYFKWKDMPAIEANHDDPEDEETMKLNNSNTKT